MREKYMLCLVPVTRKAKMKKRTIMKCPVRPHRDCTFGNIICCHRYNHEKIKSCEDNGCGGCIELKAREKSTVRQNTDRTTKVVLAKTERQMKQKFKSGDLVMITKNLGSCMSHFKSDCEAIVIGSYADKFGGNNTNSYTLHIKGQGEVSWYYETQLTLVAHKQDALLKKWKKEEDTKDELESDLDWIFTNGLTVCKGASGSTISALAKCLGITNLWGSRGEGYVYHQNALSIMALARNYLVTNDKKGWLQFCKETIVVFKN